MAGYDYSPHPRTSSCQWPIAVNRKPAATPQSDPDIEFVEGRRFGNYENTTPRLGEGTVEGEAFVEGVAVGC